MTRTKVHSRRSGPDGQIEWGAACSLATARGARLLDPALPDWWRQIDVTRLVRQGPGVVLSWLHAQSIDPYDRLQLRFCPLGREDWLRRHGFVFDETIGAPSILAGQRALAEGWERQIAYRAGRAARMAEAEALRQGVLVQMLLHREAVGALTPQDADALQARRLARGGC